MPLQQSHADPRNTGTTWPEAYGLVTAWSLQSALDHNVVSLTWWADKAAYEAGRAPVDQQTVILTAQEQTAGVGQLMGVLEQLLLARTEYGSAVQVP